jgi:hypothetical protein
MVSKDRQSMATQPRAAALGRLVAVAVVVLVVAAPLVASAAGTAGGADAQAQERLDVVFVVDRSDSADDERKRLLDVVGQFGASIERSSVDAQYAVLSYNATVHTEQPLTDDYGDVQRAMQFEVAGSTENASKAIMAVPELDLRWNAETVVVLVTDEDDDGTSAERIEARQVASEKHFVAVSPESPSVSSCDEHSEPCDDSPSNELRPLADRVGGTWIDGSLTADRMAQQLVDAVGAAVDVELPPAAEPTPAIETTAAAANTTTVAPGDPVGVTVTLANDGAAEGEHRVTLSADGEVLDELTVTVPAGSTLTVTLATSFEEPGTHQLAVGDRAVGTVEVLAEGTDMPTSTAATDPTEDPLTDTASEAGEEPQSGAPGFAVVTGLLAVLVILGLFYRSI